MKVRISTASFGEEALMVCVENDNLKERFLFGIDYNSILRREGWFWLYDVKQERMLFHNSESLRIQKLK